MHTDAFLSFWIDTLRTDCIPIAKFEKNSEYFRMIFSNLNRGQSSSGVGGGLSLAEFDEFHLGQAMTTTVEESHGRASSHGQATCDDL